MNLISRTTLILLVVFCSLLIVEGQSRRKVTRHRTHRTPPPCTEGTAYRNCEACGTAQSAKVRALNVLKNRDPAVTDPEDITVAAMRDPKNDSGKFTPDKQVRVRGFVASVVPGGFQESCNCGRSDLQDLHINIVAKPSEVGNLSKYVVVEFTPRWEEKFGFDNSNYTKMLKAVSQKIKGKWVEFSGWMAYDFMHKNASKTTMPKQPTCPDDGKEHPKCNWRATPWEVHPVTAYAVVDHP